LYVGYIDTGFNDKLIHWLAYELNGDALPSLDHTLDLTNDIRNYDQLMSAHFHSETDDDDAPYIFVPFGKAATLDDKYVNKTSLDGTIVASSPKITPDNWELRALYVSPSTDPYTSE
jgi:hypothetical protein